MSQVRCRPVESPTNPEGTAGIDLSLLAEEKGREHARRSCIVAASFLHPEEAGPSAEVFHQHNVVAFLIHLGVQNPAAVAGNGKAGWPAHQILFNIGKMGDLARGSCKESSHPILTNRARTAAQPSTTDGTPSGTCYGD